jgi:hypothetical protein
LTESNPCEFLSRLQTTADWLLASDINGPIQILGISADTRNADLPEEITPLFYAEERIEEIGFFESSGILQNLQCFTFLVQLYFDPVGIEFLIVLLENHDMLQG